MPSKGYNLIVSQIDIFVNGHMFGFYIFTEVETVGKSFTNVLKNLKNKVDISILAR